MSATTPAMLIIQLIAPTTMSLTSVTQLPSMAQFFVKSAPRAMRIVLSMTLDKRTMARPMKAWTRVFLPVASLPGSPAASIYK